MPDLELLDAGESRRLERFGDVIVDRPAPGAESARRDVPVWSRAQLVFRRGRWSRGSGHEPWQVHVAGLVLECRPASGGQVGLFPEHSTLWPGLTQASAAARDDLGRPPEVLALFAYTGGASLAAALGGASVTHVDSSRPAIAWGRRNADLSGLADRPIRWLPDDARAFVRRERRRGRRYDGIVLDPPSYGHGTGAWRIDDDLPPLLEDLAALVGPAPRFVLLTAHTPGYGGDRLASLVREHFNLPADGRDLVIPARSGAWLRLGAWARTSPPRRRGSARMGW
jgi:23S rRNA (cytosine1962-C5)-methyltransferase